MKKGTGIGIGVSIIVIAIVVGIASLPDDVLIEGSSLEKSTNILKNEALPEKSLQSPATNEPVAEKPAANETTKQEPIESSEKHIIQVEIVDGIGSGDK